MKKQINTLLSELSESYYNEVKTILCSKDSYKRKVDLKAIKHYIKYLEKSLDDPSDYLYSLNIIIYKLSQNDLPDILMPFRFLTFKASERINDYIKQGGQAYACSCFLDELVD